MDKPIRESESVQIAEGEMPISEDAALIRQSDRQIDVTSQRAYTVYILLPLIFLLVTLLGGLRLAAPDNAFIFGKPALVCLVFAAISIFLFFRSGLLLVDGWLGETMSNVQNAANLAVLLTLFTATVQVYNCLLPEQGLPFWVLGFCFFWTLWTNIFADFDARRLLKSLTALFGLAFVVKYLVLANLTAGSEASWWQRIIENPGKEAFTWLLDLPGYSAGTGYIQFFTLSLYLIGLLLLPRKAN